jgi:hypothetical protein
MTESRQFKRGRWRPVTAPPGRGQGVLVRVHPELLGWVDRWIAATDAELSRPEAIRRLTEMSLLATRQQRRDERRV